MLKLEQIVVTTTKVKPFDVVGDNVRSFRLDELPPVMDGDLLHMGTNGKVYAVFPTQYEGIKYFNLFPNCRFVELTSGSWGYDLSNLQ